MPCLPAASRFHGIAAYSTTYQTTGGSGPGIRNNARMPRMPPPPPPPPPLLAPQASTLPTRQHYSRRRRPHRRRLLLSHHRRRRRGGGRAGRRRRRRCRRAPRASARSASCARMSSWVRRWDPRSVSVPSPPRFSPVLCSVLCVSVVAMVYKAHTELTVDPAHQREPKLMTLPGS